MTIASKTRIGIASPHIFADGNVDMDLVRRYAVRAEALGYASLWTQERVTGTQTSLDPITFLSYLAGQTTRVRLGVSVFVLPRHNPVHLAKHLASLDQLSGGRLIVGVGLGGNAAELPMYGMSPERRVRRFIEHVEIMKALWTQSPASYAGDFYSFDGVSIAPQPVQKPHPPLWFGASAEPAVRRALRLGDGWTGAGSAGREAFSENVERVKGWLAEEGRDPASFPISKRVYLAIDDDEERARRRLKEWFAFYYGNAELAERVGVWGAAGRVQEQLAAWSEAGVSEFILNPVFDMEEHLERLAEVTGLVS
ncbi:MAG: LLM class flavin-dependent oxidoreductase [Chloroflexi bacterium]|nr:LLM class flavin-dependent oxidoreductase [Chloroflexota bacterium]